MSKDDMTVRNMAKRYVAWITKERENPLPKVIQPAAQKVTEFLSQRPKDESHRQDEQLMVLREQQEAAKRQLAEQEATLRPRDGGEIDGPAPDPNARQPIQMQREFSNDQEKEAYLERIRQAQKNAKK